MEIDTATRNNLEITTSLSGDIKGSLLNSIDLFERDPEKCSLNYHVKLELPANFFE